MSRLEFAWTAMGAFSVALAAVHLLIALRRRRGAVPHLFMAACAGSVVVVAALEMAMMRAPAPAAYATLLRSRHRCRGDTSRGVAEILSAIPVVERATFATYFTAFSAASTNVLSK